jgi:hypothetical protein
MRQIEAAPFTFGAPPPQRPSSPIDLEEIARERGKLKLRKKEREEMLEAKMKKRKQRPCFKEPLPQM